MREQETFINKDILNRPDAYFSYVLGLIWADGSIDNRENHTKQIRVEILKIDADKIKENFNKTGCWKIFSRHRNNRQETSTFYSSDKELFKILENNDYLDKKTKSADKIIEFVGKNNLKYWLCGLIDGDGSIYLRQQTLGKRLNKNWFSFSVSIYSTINQDWTFLEKVLKSLKVKYKILKRIRNTGSSSEIKLQGKMAAKFCDFIYKDSITVLGRKKEIYNTYLKNHQGNCHLMV